MIFYDKGKRRKFYFWGSAFLLIVVFLAFASFTVFGIATDSDGAKRLDSGHSFYSELNGSKKLALTFDDGPHPVHTIDIVETLKKHEVPATFFFVGENILKHKDVVKEVHDKGFEIGNHTFTHSRSVHDSKERLKWELNATSVLVETITGRSTVLYRPPFLLDIDINTTVDPSVLKMPLEWAADNGYVVVGADIDSRDWTAASPEEVLENLESELEGSSGSRHVILMHDGGADIRHTPAALDTIITRLKSEGYEFVPVSHLVGLTRVEATPLAEHNIPYQRQIYSFFASLIALTGSTVVFVIWTASLLVAVRVFFVLLLRYVIAPSVKKSRQSLGSKKRLKIGVIIPAYNEQENLESTIHSVMNSSVRPDEVMVVNDGSTDNTSVIARRAEGQYPGVVRVIDIENGGKARALNIGIGLSAAEVVITLDADTIFDKDAIKNLVGHFKDEEVGAVAGKVYPANNSRLLSKFQEIEYIVSQNIEKQGMSTVNAVGVAPGAVSAWRKSAVLECGGYSNDTLVEDQDITLAVLERGHKVVYEPKAIAYTEVPTTILGFVSQRFRWFFGSMQCFLEI